MYTKHTYIPTYLHACMHAYIHTYIAGYSVCVSCHGPIDNPGNENRWLLEPTNQNTRMQIDIEL